MMMHDTCCWGCWLSFKLPAVNVMKRCARTRIPQPLVRLQGLMQTAFALLHMRLLIVHVTDPRLMIAI